MHDENTDNLMDANPSAMLASVDQDKMRHWSFEERCDFAKLFQERTYDAQTILLLTARDIVDKAQRRKYISTWHVERLEAKLDVRVGAVYNRQRQGGRAWNELERIAAARAAAIIKELPESKAAVAVIHPDVAVMMERQEVIATKCEQLNEQLGRIPDAVSMEDQDQNMTLKEFRAMLVKHVTDKTKLVKEMNVLADENARLEEKVAEKLYKGLPGLSDAVIDVVREHIERSRALDTLQRRVTESVKFGDSEAAASLLATFEKDEVAISDDLRAKLAASLEVLKGKVKELKAKDRAKKKQLRGGK